MKFDMTKLNTDFEPVPEGDYTGVIEECTEGTSPNTGSAYIEMKIRLANNRLVWDRLWCDAPAKAKFVAKACGVDFDGEMTTAMLLGKTVAITIIIDDSGDKPRNKVTTYTVVTEANVPF